MKKLTKSFAAIMLMTAVFFTAGCTPEKEVKVTTSTPREITLTTAVCGGRVEASEGVTLSELGVCWDTVKDPTVNNDHLFTSNWSEPYEDTIKDLMPGTEYHVRAYAYNGSDYFYGEDKSFTTDGGGSGGGGNSGGIDTIPPTPNDTLFVDLGLPSGILWAKCNVGANAPEEYGDYFAWGETETKPNYLLDNYKYYNKELGKFTKYTSEDGLSVIQPTDDAASVNWGLSCRMPTKEEWEELLQNTTITWTTINDVNGCNFTGINGKSIFLPAAGFQNDNPKDYFFGMYWSSLLDILDDLADDAWYLFFSISDGELGFEMEAGYERSCGASVRPVRSVR